MEVVHARCAGLDIHKDTVVACRRVVAKHKVQAEVRTFLTTTRGLLELRGWLLEVDCNQVVMESTGIYWKPVWHTLEEGFGLVLALKLARIFFPPGSPDYETDSGRCVSCTRCFSACPYELLRRGMPVQLPAKGGLHGNS